MGPTGNLKPGQGNTAPESEKNAPKKDCHEVCSRPAIIEKYSEIGKSRPRSGEREWILNEQLNVFTKWGIQQLDRRGVIGSASFSVRLDRWGVIGSASFSVPHCPRVSIRYSIYAIPPSYRYKYCGGAGCFVIPHVFNLSVINVTHKRAGHTHPMKCQNTW